MASAEFSQQYQIAMIPENHPTCKAAQQSGASGRKYRLAAMDKHPVGLQMFGKQSKSVFSASEYFVLEPFPATNLRLKMSEV